MIFVSRVAVVAVLVNALRMVKPLPKAVALVVKLVSAFTVLRRILALVACGTVAVADRPLVLANAIVLRCWGVPSRSLS